MSALLGLFLIACDVLRPIEGGEIVAKTIRQGNEIVLETPMGRHRFPATDFRPIVAAPNWSEKQTVATKGGAAECCTAALWALDHGLVVECEAMIREANRKDPKHQPSARMVAILDRLKTPIKDPTMAPLSRNLPADPRIARGEHVLLMHQHSDEEAAERVAILEIVISAYYLYFASIGIDLSPPTERLASMWFAKKADYLSFLKLEGATAFLTTRGFYQPTRRIVVAYDCRDDANRIKAREANIAAQGELDRFAAQVEKIPVKGRARITVRGEVKSFDRQSAKVLEASLRRQVERRDIILELSRREMDLGVAAHETIHQLAAVSKLCPAGSGFPNSLSEGLAMQFESIEGGRWAGLSKPASIRLHDYRKLESPPKFDPIIRDIGFGPGYKADDYAKAWGLVYYLRVERPKVFLSLLDALRAPSEPSTTVVTRAGNSLSSLLAENENELWHRFMKGLAVRPEPFGP